MIWFGDEQGRDIGPNHKGTICAWSNGKIVARCETEKEKDPKQAAGWQVTPQGEAPQASLVYGQNALATLFSANILTLKILLHGMALQKKA